MANDGTTTSPAKRTAIEMGSGALLGLVGWSLVGPALISLWYEPPSGSLSCGPSVEGALSKFVVMQLICAGVGGVMLIALFFFGRRAVANRRKAIA